MSTDIEGRLRAYRSDLDAAIEDRMTESVAYVPAQPEPSPVRRRWVVGVALSTAVAALLAMVMVLTPADGDRTVVPLATPTEGRLLLDAPGWHMSRIDERGEGGEMTFTDGTHEADLKWTRGDAAALQQEVESRFGKFEPNKLGPVPGTGARVFKYSGADDYVALWSNGVAFYEFRTRAASAEAFTDLAGHVRAVDLPTWQAALPASAVPSEARAGEVDRMLTGVPLPPAFDPAGLRTSEQTKDRYQLGAEVSGAVVCGWIQEWTAARAAGDNGRASAASAALSSSHEWAVLEQMNAEGDYPEVVWQYADAIATGGTVPAGKRVSVEDSYRDALGCR